MRTLRIAYSDSPRIIRPEIVCYNVDLDLTAKMCRKTDIALNRFRGRGLIKVFGCRMPSEEEPVAGVCDRRDRLARSDARFAERGVAWPSIV